MNAVLNPACLVDRTVFDEVVGTDEELQARARETASRKRLSLRDVPHPVNNDECREWASHFRNTNDARWLRGIQAAASMMSLARLRDETGRAMAATANPRLREFLRGESRGLQGLVVADACERAMQWEPDKGALGTFLWKPVTGQIRDAFAKLRKQFAHEALFEDLGVFTAAHEPSGNYVNRGEGSGDDAEFDDAESSEFESTALNENDRHARQAARRRYGEDAGQLLHDDSLRQQPHYRSGHGGEIRSRDDEGAALGVRFRDEPELSALIKSLAAGLYDDLNYLADERAVLFHQLIPMASGEPGLRDRELAEILKRPVSWVGWKRRELIGEMREALAARGLTP